MDILRTILHIIILPAVVGMGFFFLLRRKRQKIKSLTKDLVIAQSARDKAKETLVMAQEEEDVLRRFFLSVTAINILSDLVHFFEGNPDLWVKPPRDIDDKILIIGEAIPYKNSNQLVGEIDAVIVFLEDILNVFGSEKDFFEYTLFDLAKEILEKRKSVLLNSPLSWDSREVAFLERKWRCCLNNYVENR